MMHDTRVAAQKTLHSGFVQILKENMILLKPPAKSGNGIDLARH
jgi:hypothetical protein